MPVVACCFRNKPYLCTILNISAVFKADKDLIALLYGGGSGNAHIVTEMTKDT